MRTKKTTRVMASILFTVLFAISGLTQVLPKHPVCVTGEMKVKAGATSTVLGVSGLSYVGADLTAGYRELDEILVVNTSDSITGAVFVAKSELGVSTLLETYNTILPGDSATSRPRVTIDTQTIAGHMISNNVLVATTTVVTDYERPSFKNILITITNAPSAKDGVFLYMIKAH